MVMGLNGYAEGKAESRRQFRTAKKKKAGHNCVGQLSTYALSTYLLRSCGAVLERNTESLICSSVAPLSSSLAGRGR